jgi:hypothetical protein
MQVGESFEWIQLGDYAPDQAILDYMQCLDIAMAGSEITSFELRWDCMAYLQRFRISGPNKLADPYEAFDSCVALVTIPELNVEDTPYLDDMFIGCTALKGVNLVAPSVSFSIAGCQLEHDALVALIGLLATVAVPCTCTITGNPGVPELTVGEIAIATDKGWTLVTE